MSKTIMIIEDNLTLLDLYRVMLTDEGYKVLTQSSRSSQDDTFAVIKQLQPDLLVVDLMIGRKEKGWTLIQAIRRDATTANIPVILCSGNSRRVKELEQDLKAEDVRIILKPFKVDDFIKLVEQALL